MVLGNEGNEGIKGKTVMLCMCMDGMVYERKEWYEVMKGMKE